MGGGVHLFADNRWDIESTSQNNNISASSNSVNIPSQAELREFSDSELESGYDRETNTWEVIVKYNGDILRIEKELGVEIELLSEDYAIVTLEGSKIETLNSYKEIEHIEKPKNLAITINEGLTESCIRPVQSVSGFNLSGKGTIVAIIDSGIDYTHPDFRNDDGTTRILYIWDQTAIGNPPEGFRNGAQYDEKEINRALASEDPYTIIPEIDYNGHGTAVAGVAAGNGRASKGENKGAAPEASIIAVKLGEKGRKSFTRTTEMMRAIKYVVSIAERINMPISVNISFGTNNGSHDGSSLFETFIDEMAQKWKTAIVVASGNEGSAAHHHAGKMQTGEMATIEFFGSAGLNSFFITLWKNFVDTFTIELVLPNGKTTGEITYTDQSKVVNFNDTGVYVYYGQPRHFNEDQEIFFQIKALKETVPEGLWKIKIRALEVVDGRYDIWLPITEIVTERTSFSIPTSLTTLTLPSTSERVITVGGYDHRLNSIASFSGRGYTRNDVYVKPDLVAPAVNIIAPKKGGGYDSFTGTSIAAPFVTGAIALMMEWGIIKENDPFLYGQRVKAFLKIGTLKEKKIPYPNPEWGYGSLCLKQTMDILKDYMKGGQTISKGSVDALMKKEHKTQTQDDGINRHLLALLIMFIMSKQT